MRLLPLLGERAGVRASQARNRQRETAMDATSGWAIRNYETTNATVRTRRFGMIYNLQSVHGNFRHTVWLRIISSNKSTRPGSASHMNISR